MPTPTLEELLALKEKMSSLSSFQKDTEESVVSDALAAPVRPEYTQLLEEEKKNQPMTGFTSPEERAIKQLNEYDRLRETPSRQKSAFDDARLADFKSRLNPAITQNSAVSPVSQDSAPSVPFYPTLTGAAISEKQLDIAPAAPKRALASALPTEKQTEDSQLEKILQQPSEYEDLLARFRDAQERQRMAQLGVGLTQAAERIGSAIAMTKPGDQSVYEQAMKQAGGITEQFKEEEAMAREAKRQDPKSAESEAARQLLKEQGVTVPDTVSAAFIEKQYPQLAGIIRSKEDAKREAIGRQERAEERQERMLERLDGKKRELALRLAPKIQNKKYETYTELLAQKNLVDEAVRNPNPQRDITVFYSFVKALDPESVVREGELKFVQTSRSIPDGLRQTLKNALTGEKLSKEERLRIQDFMNQRLQLAQKQWEDSASPFLKQTSEAGIEQELVAPGTAAASPQAQEKNPKVQEYANTHFNGDYNKALQFLESKRKK